MNALNLQMAFFKQLKESHLGHNSFVDTIAELLNISNDSAYRRIRGEKFLTFDEIEKLAHHFKLSLDSFLHLQNGGILFSGNYIDNATFTFENYLGEIVRQLSFFNHATEKEMISLHKDIPIFHHFLFPELAAFKCYFWSRYNLNYVQFNRNQFVIDDYMETFKDTGAEIYNLYRQIPSTEIWNLDCINTTIRQIDYYRKTGVFKSKDDIDTIYNCLENLVSHIEIQVEKGYKLNLGLDEQVSNGKYQVFINDFILGDNTILVQLDSVRMVFLNHNVINFIMTSDPQFVNYTSKTLQVLLKKSTLISEIGEKERLCFFDKLRERIHDNRKLV